MSLELQQAADDYQRVEQALGYLAANRERQPGLGELAASIHLSEYHFQRLFKRWAGISPKRFLQFLTKEHAKELLVDAASLLEATYASGLSSPGRLHDLFVQTEAVTPGEYKRRGQGLQIFYGFHPTPFGECLLALTERGICHLSFVQGDDRSAALALLKIDWPRAQLVEAPERTAPFAKRIFTFKTGESTPLNLHLRGTNFQLKVWEALLRIPPGELTSYERIAAEIGRPGATRAVGNALAHNPVAYLIPCHRVIRKLGDFGNYRHGPLRKQALLGWEMARKDETRFDPDAVRAGAHY
jgi:AraC family transcriptional regulator of adaptative response/methylated-DNA-[protein]-cysteine methyltransferase